MFKILKDLCLTNSISGYEHKTIKFIASQLTNKCLIKYDNLGNLIAKNNDLKSKKKVLILSTIDEVGLIINNIEEDGSLRFLTIGKIKPDALIGSTVKIGNIYGTIGQKPPHLQSTNEKNTPSIETLFIDIGCDNKRQALEKISLGDTATFRTDFLEYGQNRINSKSINSKIGCSILLKLLQTCNNCDFFCAFLTKSHISNASFTTVANLIYPDIAIILNSFEESIDLDKSNNYNTNNNFKLKLHPSTDKAIFQTAIDTAKYNKFRFDVEISNNLNEYEKSIIQTKNGIKTLTISVPCRLINSNCSNLCLNDAKKTLKYLNKLILKLNEAF